MKYTTNNPKTPRAKPRPIVCPDCGSTDLQLIPGNKQIGQDLTVVCSCGWRGYPQWPVEEVA